jgi:hypothetical protein
MKLYIAKVNNHYYNMGLSLQDSEVDHAKIIPALAHQIVMNRTTSKCENFRHTHLIHTYMQVCL